MNGNRLDEMSYLSEVAGSSNTTLSQMYIPLHINEASGERIRTAQWLKKYRESS
jgi:hypothetical protein